MLKLIDLIRIMDRDTVVCVCDNMGPLTNVAPLKEISILSLMDDLNRTVTRIYFDKEDGSITIELEDYKDEEGSY